MTKIQINDRTDETSLRVIDQAELAQIEGGFFLPPQDPSSPGSLPKDLNPFVWY